MFELAIRCPVTGLPVSTGEKTANEPFLQSIAQRILKECPACSGTHSWQIRESWPIPSSEAASESRDTEML